MPALDVRAARRDTPGCEQRVHLNNAGASLMPRPVLDAVHEHLDLEARIGGYEAAGGARERLDAVYASAARLIGCEPGEIALLENATRAFNGVLYALPWQRGDRLVTGRAEYCSNFMSYLHLEQREGVEITVVPDDPEGQIDVAALEDTLDERVKLIALSHVPTSGGLVNPAARVGAAARAAAVPFLLDACQSVGQMPIDVDEIGCDFLGATGRKYLRGPRGTGFLYAAHEASEALHPTALDVGGAEWTADDAYVLKPGARRFETWEASTALQLGLGRAIDYALERGLEDIWRQVGELAGELRATLAELPGVTLHDRGATRCGIVTFTVAGTPADAVRERLAAGGVNVYVSRVEDTRLDLAQRGLDSIVRASVHYFNTREEIARACELIAEIPRVAA
jgi:cysteine desulfurase/selenocysteine lyase